MSELMEQPAVEVDSNNAATSAVPEENTQEQPSLLDGGEQVQENQPDPDEVEEELEGLKLRGKKEQVEKLRAERLMHGDYTRKTQEVAEYKRTVEAERQQYQQQAQFQQLNIREMGRLGAIDERLAQLGQVNLPQLAGENPEAAQKLHMELTQLQAARGQLVGTLTQRQQQMALIEQQATAKRVQDAQAVLARDLKGWGPELQTQLKQTGREFGFSDEELGNVQDPRAVKLLHEVHLYRQLLKAQAAKPKAPPLPKPVTKVSGGAASNTKALSDTSMEEFIKRRREYRAKNR